MASDSMNTINKPNEENKWISILDEVRQSMNVPTKKATIIFLGGRESGKTSLADRLLPRKSGAVSQLSSNVPHFGLESHYIELSNDESTDGKMDIWIADGDGICAQMLHYAINESTLGNTLVVLTVSIGEPWNILSEIGNLLDLIKRHVQSLQQQSVEDHCCLLESKYEDDWRPEIRLPIPVLVVVTKSDLMIDLRKDFNYMDEHFEFIQMHIRTLCLKYGAGLLFTSNQRVLDKDDIFRSFVMQTCFNIEPSNDCVSILTANQMDFENAYIPPGWDRSFKISVLSQAFKHLDVNQIYSDVIRNPNSNNIDNFNKTLLSEIIAEGYQDFLEGMKNKLVKKSTINDSNDKQMKKTEVIRRGSHSGAKKSQSTDTFLSTIFNNLLSKPQLLQNAKNSQTRNDHSKPVSTGASTQSLKDRLSTAGLDLSTSSSNASVTFSTITEEASAKEKVDDCVIEDSS